MAVKISENHKRLLDEMVKAKIAKYQTDSKQTSATQIVIGSNAKALENSVRGGVENPFASPLASRSNTARAA